MSSFALAGRRVLDVEPSSMPSNSQSGKSTVIEEEKTPISSRGHSYNHSTNRIRQASFADSPSNKSPLVSPKQTNKQSTNNEIISQSVKRRGVTREMLGAIVRKQQRNARASVNLDAALTRLTHLPLDKMKLTQIQPIAFTDQSNKQSSDKSDSPSSSQRNSISSPNSYQSNKQPYNQSLDNPLSLCEQTEVIYLHENLLQSLDGLDFCPNLTHLYIGYNQIDSLVDSLSCCPKLTKLYAGHNRLRSLDGLEQCSRLEELHISHQSSNQSSNQTVNLSINQPYLTLSPSIMSCFPSLRVLDVASCGLTDSSILAIRECRRLDTINMANNLVQNLDTIQALLQATYNLRSLDTRMNPVNQPSTLSNNQPTSQPVNQSAKYRDQLVLASSSALTLLDDKQVTPQERVFLQRLEGRKQQRQERDFRNAAAAEAQLQNQLAASQLSDRDELHPSPSHSQSQPISAQPVRHRQIQNNSKPTSRRISSSSAIPMIVGSTSVTHSREPSVSIQR